MKSTSPFTVSCCFLFVMICLLFSPLLSGRWLYFFHDLKAFYLPAKFLFSSCLHKGYLILWTHLSTGGFPLHAEGQTAVFYPFNIVLFGLFPFHWAVTFSFILHASIGSIGMFLFARSNKVSVDGSLVAAIIFTLSGFWMTHLFHLSIYMACAWVPLLFHLCRQVIYLKKSHWIIFTLFFGMQILLGHPQITFISTMGVILYCFGLFFSRKEKSLSLKGFYPLFIALLLALLLGAVQILPTLELIPFSTRGNIVEDSFSSTGSFPPHHFVTLVFPYFFGINSLQARHLYESIFPDVSFSPWNFGGLSLRESHVYIGIFPWIVIFWLLLTGKVRKVPFSLLFLTISALIFALGKYSPLFPLLSLLSPGNFFRMPVRFWILVTFALAGISGFSWDIFIQMEREEMKKLLRGLMSVLIVLLIILPATHFLISKTFENKTMVKENISHHPNHDKSGDNSDKEESRPLFNKIRNGLLRTMNLANPVIFFPLCLLSAFSFIIWARIRGLGHKTFRTGILLLLTVDLFVFVFPYNAFTESAQIVKKPDNVTTLRHILNGHERFIVLDKTQESFALEMDSLYADGPYSEFLHPCYNLFWQLPNLGTVSPLSLWKWDQLHKKLGIGFEPESHNVRVHKLAETQQLLSFLQIRAIISQRNQLFHHNTFTQKYASGGATIFVHNRTILPLYTYDYEHIQFVATEKETLASLCVSTFNPECELLLAVNQQAKVKAFFSRFSADQRKDQKNDFELKHYHQGLHQIDIGIKNDAPRVVALPVTWYPGWKATSKGKELPIFTGQFLFQSFCLPPGIHEVNLRYSPFSVKLGLFLSCIAILLVFLLFLNKSNYSNK